MCPAYDPIIQGQSAGAMQLHFYPRPEGERLLFQGEMTNQNLKGVQSASVFLNVGEYLQEIFDTREDEGFEGSGYDWRSLA